MTTIEFLPFFPFLFYDRCCHRLCSILNSIYSTDQGTSSASFFRHFVSEIFVLQLFPSLCTPQDRSIAVLCPNLYRWIWSVHSVHLWLIFLFVDLSKRFLAFVAIPTSRMLYASISRLSSVFKIDIFTTYMRATNMCTNDLINLFLVLMEFFGYLWRFVILYSLFFTRLFVV